MGEDSETDRSVSRRRILQLSGVSTAGGLFVGEASADDDDDDDDWTERIQVSVVGPTEPTVGTEYEYTAAVSDGPGDESYFWGASGEVVGPNDEETATVRFDSPGTHQVAVLVTDGQIDAGDTLEVTVGEDGGGGELDVEIEDAPQQVQAGREATFSAEANRDPSYVSYTWTVDGETFSAGSSVTIPFSESGTKAVEVVADDGTEEASDTREIEVFDVGIDGWEEVVVGGPFEYYASVQGPVEIDAIDWTVRGSADHTVEEKAGGSAIEVELDSTGWLGISLAVETAAGYEGTTTFRAEVVEAIQNFRLVQTVENTHVRHTDDPEDVIHEEPDPDFVADREVSVAFELQGEPFEEETSVEFVLDRTRRNLFSGEEVVVTSSFELTGDEPEELVGSDGIADIYHEEPGLWEPDAPSEDPPIFTLDELTGWIDERLELSIQGPSFDVPSVEIERHEHFTVQQPHTLRVGFVQVQDPEEGDLYGSNDGLPINYEGFVDDAINYLGRMFPTEKVVAYRHDEPIEGAYKHENDWDDEYEKVEADRDARWYDAFTAKHLLMEELCEQGGIDESETVDGNGEIPSDTGFDETVLVVPSGYYDYHEIEYTDGGLCGEALPMDQPEPMWAVTARCSRSTTPHELVHSFLHGVYRDEERDEYQDEDSPLAERTGWNQNIEEWDEIDGSHVRGFTDTDDDHNVEDPYGVRLTFFDLEGGEFHVEQGANSIMEQPNRPEGDWIDSRAFSRLIEDGFTTTIDPDEEEDYEIDCDEWVDVVEGFASVEESGHVSIQAFRLRAGRPMTSDDDGNVTIEVRDDEGETLSKYMTKDEWEAHTHGDGHETVEAVPFRLYYPIEAAEIRFERPATTTTVDPRAVPLDGVMARVAPESFVKNPEDRHQSLADKFDSVVSQLEADAYQGAYKKLTNDVRPRIQEWLQNDISVPENYYTKTELLALVDETIARLEVLYDLHDDHPGCGPPDDHPGQGPPEDHPGRGPPDDPPGCDPPDDHPGRGPPDDDDDRGRGPPGDDDDDDPGRGPPGDDDPPGNGPPGDDDPGRGPPDDDRGGPRGT